MSALDPRTTRDDPRAFGDDERRLRESAALEASRPVPSVRSRVMASITDAPRPPRPTPILRFAGLAAAASIALVVMSIGDDATRAPAPDAATRTSLPTAAAIDVSRTDGSRAAPGTDRRPTLPRITDTATPAPRALAPETWIAALADETRALTAEADASLRDELTQLGADAASGATSLAAHAARPLRALLAWTVR